VLKLAMTNLIQRAGILLDATASSPEEAVRICGELLVKLGSVSDEYAKAMWEREQAFSSAIGMGFAIPHGTDDSRKYVKFDQLVFLRLQSEVQWGEERVKAVLGIASQGDAHVEILGNFAELVQVDADREALLTTGNGDQVLALLSRAG
jgi:mannitol/fructose-specific phosphotransferase system IIA component